MALCEFMECIVFFLYRLPEPYYLTRYYLYRGSALGLRTAAMKVDQFSIVIVAFRIESFLLLLYAALAPALTVPTWYYFLKDGSSKDTFCQ